MSMVCDRIVLLLSGRQGALVEVCCVLRAEAAAAAPRYTLLPSARSLLGCIRSVCRPFSVIQRLNKKERSNSVL